LIQNLPCVSERTEKRREGRERERRREGREAERERGREGLFIRQIYLYSNIS
jgi:hypothetical protein